MCGQLQKQKLFQRITVSFSKTKMVVMLVLMIEDNFSSWLLARMVRQDGRSIAG